MPANFQGSSFKIRNFQNYPFLPLSPPLAPMGVVIFLGYLAKKSYNCPICMYANFQSSSFKTEDFFQSVYLQNGEFEKLTLFATLTPPSTKGVVIYS